MTTKLLLVEDDFEVKRLVTAHVELLSGAGTEEERVFALLRGADDYVMKPFFVRELTARVLAATRRRAAQCSRVLRFGDLSIDLTSREVCRAGVDLCLTTKEYDLLVFLSNNPQRVFSRAELLHAVWHSASSWQGEATVTEHIRRLRGKIDVACDRPSLLRTVRSAGYSFDPVAVDHTP